MIDAAVAQIVSTNGSLRGDEFTEILPPVGNGDSSEVSRAAARPQAKRSFITVQEHAAQAREGLGTQIVEGMGGPGDVVELFGDEGAAKTRTVLGLADSLISKATWGPFRINRNGKVLLLETDMPETGQAEMIEQFVEHGAFSSGGLLTLPYGRPSALYHVRSDQKVDRVYTHSKTSDLIAVVIDTWSSLFTVDGGAENAYLESNIRAMVGRLRQDYPTALLIVVNHTTSDGNGGSRALSPGLRRIATTRYKIKPPQERDNVGRWIGSGSLEADGKFSRSAALPRKVPLQWDWSKDGNPAPYPTLVGLGPAEWIALFPDIEGLTGKYESRSDALRDLERVSGIKFETLKTAQHRHPNPALEQLGER